MVDAALFAEFSRTREQHELVGRALVPLVERMALELVAEVLLGTHVLEVHGEINEDWLPILRIQRVLDAWGAELFHADDGHDDRAVEDAIDIANTEYLDLLMDLTGDEYLGTKTLER
jgi:hypothetical protein